MHLCKHLTQNLSEIFVVFINIKYIYVKTTQLSHDGGHYDISQIRTHHLKID